MKVLERKAVPLKEKKSQAKTEEKKIIVTCKNCCSKLEVSRTDLNMINGALDIHDFDFCGCEFRCPVCNEMNYTDEKQEFELGYPRRGFR